MTSSSLILDRIKIVNNIKKAAGIYSTNLIGKNFEKTIARNLRLFFSLKKATVKII